MCEITGFTHCGLSTIARILSCLTRCVVSAQEILNTVWYRFALYTAKRVGKWPQIRYNVRRGRIETAQEYQFDHIGLGPIETLV